MNARKACSFANFNFKVGNLMIKCHILIEKIFVFKFIGPILQPMKWLKTLNERLDIGTEHELQGLISRHAVLTGWQSVELLP